MSAEIEGAMHISEDGYFVEEREKRRGGN